MQNQIDQKMTWYCKKLEVFHFYRIGHNLDFQADFAL